MILTASLFSSCYYKVSAVPPKKDTYTPLSSAHYPLGSRRYIQGIQKLAAAHGYKAALNTLMTDVGKYGNELDRNSYQDNLNFYRLTSYLIGKTGYVDMKTHYFRNKLNRAPASLKELLYQNSALPLKKRWKLLSVPNSLYHMQGVNGEYNLKFVSPDGFCEAVYNKNGMLLTEKNDPVNMGTFNYCAGITEVNAHVKYDITPYLQWGNSENSPQKEKTAIEKGKALGYENYREHAASVIQYRNNIMKAYSASSSLPGPMLFIRPLPISRLFF